MSDADLETKFRGLVTGVLPERRVSELIAACWSLETLEDAGEIARLATARPHGRSGPANLSI